MVRRAPLLLRNMSDGSEFHTLDEAWCSKNRGKADKRSARRQLAFDIWWLGFALWLVCIIEVSMPSVD